MTKQVNFDGSRASLIKGMERGSSFELENMVDEMVEYRGYLKPRLLTNIFNPSIIPMADNVFKYDQDVSTAMLPKGKRFDDRGPITQKDRPTQQMFEIPSNGAQYVIKNRDVKNKRIPGTGDMMTHEYLIAREQNRIMDGYDLFNEYNFGKLLTTDTMDNLDGGEFYTPANYYTDIVGGSRTVINTNLAATDLSTYRGLVEDQRDRITEEAQRHGRNITGWVMICGKGYFEKVRALEEQENLAREIRGIDLAQEGTPTLSDGEFANLRFLDGSDGVRYIKYTASILTGTPLVASDKAYLVPLGVEDMFYIGLAPTDNDPDLCTQDGRTMYMWAEKNRSGYHFEVESNRIFGMKLPQLISHFDEAA